MITSPLGRRLAVRLLAAGAGAAALGLALTGCASTTSGDTVTGGNPAPTVTVTATAPAAGSGTAPATTAPAHYFANGKAYDAWVLSANADGTLTIALVHHLTGDDAKNYLTSHGQTIPPDGIPDDYINVDTGVHKNVGFPTTAKVTVNPEGQPQSMSAASFLSTFLPANLAQPIAASDQDTYPGAAHYSGALFAFTFQDDVVATVDQIFEP